MKEKRKIDAHDIQALANKVQVITSEHFHIRNPHREFSSDAKQFYEISELVKNERIRRVIARYVDHLEDDME